MTKSDKTKKLNLLQQKKEVIFVGLKELSQKDGIPNQLSIIYVL